jgi:hypothetical protein
MRPYLWDPLPRVDPRRQERNLQHARFLRDRELDAAPPAGPPPRPRRRTVALWCAVRGWSRA